MQEMLCCDKTDNIYSLYLVSEELIKDDTPPPPFVEQPDFRPCDSERAACGQRANLGGIGQ